MTTRTITTPTCIVCHKANTVEIDTTKYAQWQAGELIQNVWPDWTPNQRELLQTGIHPTCWDSIFGSEEPE